AAPVVVSAPTSAPASISTCTTCALPAFVATCSGVCAPTRVTARTLAPAPTRNAARSRLPCSAAQCSAVIPSPSAALTSAPRCTSERTVARSSCIAASATGDPPTRALDRTPSVSASTPTSAATSRRRTFVMVLSALSIRDPRSAIHNSERQLPRRIAELFHVGQPDLVHHAQHHVRHRRACRRLDVDVPRQLSVAAAEQNQRTALVIVDVAVAHRRPVEHDALVEQRSVPFVDR